MRKFKNTRRTQERKVNREPLYDGRKGKISASCSAAALLLSGAALAGSTREDVPVRVGADYEDIERGDSRLQKVRAALRLKLLGIDSKGNAAFMGVADSFALFLAGKYGYTDVGLKFIKDGLEHETSSRGHSAGGAVEMVIPIGERVRLGIEAGGFAWMTQDTLGRHADSEESSVQNVVGGASGKVSLLVEGWLLLEGGYSMNPTDEAFARMLLLVPSWVNDRSVGLGVDFQRARLLDSDLDFNRIRNEVSGVVRLPLVSTSALDIDAMGFTEWEVGDFEDSRHGGALGIKVGSLVLFMGADHEGRVRVSLALESMDIQGEVRVRDVGDSLDVHASLDGGREEVIWDVEYESESAPVAEPEEKPAPVKEPEPEEKPAAAPADKKVEEGDFAEDEGETKVKAPAEEPAEEGEQPELIPLVPLVPVEQESEWNLPPEDILGTGKKFTVDMDGTEHKIRINQHYVGDGAEYGAEGYLYNDFIIRKFDSDKDGLLSKEEVKAVLKSGCVACREKINNLLGEMSIDEFFKSYPNGVRVGYPLGEGVKRILEKSETRIEDISISE